MNVKQWLVRLSVSLCSYLPRQPLRTNTKTVIEMVLDSIQACNIFYRPKSSILEMLRTYKRTNAYIMVLQKHLMFLVNIFSIISEITGVLTPPNPPLAILNLNIDHFLACYCYIHFLGLQGIPTQTTAFPQIQPFNKRPSDKCGKKWLLHFIGVLTINSDLAINQ